MTQARSLPHLIGYIPTSEEMACLHEAAHVFVILDATQTPEFVEVYPGACASGRTHAPGLTLSADERLDVAAAGYAVELWLFKQGRLAGADGKRLDPRDRREEKRFIDQAVGENADKDKVGFFGPNPNGPDHQWPAALDRAFMDHGKRLSACIDTGFVEALATELLNRSRLDRAEIAAFAESRGMILL